MGKLIVANKTAQEGKVRNISYRSLKNMIFSLFAGISVLFCILIFYLGKREFDKTELYAHREESYVQSLLECVVSANSVQHSFEENFLNMPGLTNYGAENPTGLKSLKLRSHVLRRNVNRLKIKADERKATAEAHKRLIENAQLLDAIANVMPVDATAPIIEREILLREDAAAFASALSELRDTLDILLSAELSDIRTLREQGLFFYGRLKILLAGFLVFASLFSVFASFLLAFLLKKSLKTLRYGTGQISSGNLSYRFKNIPSDEIGSLMYDFNMMARHLEKNTDALQKANAKLEEKATQLLDANRHKDRFLANMSHELRTPLNSIIGFSDLIVSKSKGNDKICSYAERILSAGNHLLELISGLLDVAKADAGVLKPVITEFDLSSVLNSTCALLLPQAKAKNLSFTWKTPETCIVESDEKFVRQIIINLLNNAIKFTHEGYISLYLDVENDNCLIAVSDTGIGMTEDEQKEIFKDFHRLESGLTSNYDGVGLGLTLSKRLVEQIGGQITVKSEKGKGSVFMVKMPKKFAKSHYQN